jgi:hypothetical protein
LELTPNLSELSLGVGTVEEVSSLDRDKENILVPHLRYLTINRMDTRQNPVPALLELKKSRMVEVSGGCSPGKCLESVNVFQARSSERRGLSGRGGWVHWIETIFFLIMFLACTFPSSLHL